MAPWLPCSSPIGPCCRHHNGRKATNCADLCSAVLHCAVPGAHPSTLAPGLSHPESTLFTLLQSSRWQGGAVLRTERVLHGPIVSAPSGHGAVVGRECFMLGWLQRQVSFMAAEAIVRVGCRPHAHPHVSPPTSASPGLSELHLLLRVPSASGWYPYDIPPCATPGTCRSLLIDPLLTRSCCFKPGPWVSPVCTTLQEVKLGIVSVKVRAVPQLPGQTFWIADPLPCVWVRGCAADPGSWDSKC
jgi:hypothetical protein